ncbi:hypothetical protein ACFWFX_18740 [Streptomyces roseolus]|uniref:hypothetical protein n=1 Tax=Streptomyces roseolus TaxID=67358 RepID=UPI0036601F10
MVSTMPTSPGEPLVTALHELWAHIREATPELPPARIALSASGPPGHGPDRWTEEEDGAVAGLVITLPTLREGADAVMTEVLHHAAHLLSWQRGVADTASRGAYHTQAFVSAAEELGLCWPEGAPRHRARGYADVEPTPATTVQYAADVGRLKIALPDAVAELEPLTEKRARPERITLRCECDKPRTIKVSPTVAALGPIVCGVCRQSFTSD